MSDLRFRMVHNNFNVYDLEKSLAFYKEALGFTVLREKTAADGSYRIVFLGDGAGEHRLELTWLRDWDHPYDLGDNEMHLAVVVDDYEAAHKKHEEMGCICYENTAMGLYFIHDPDDYWIEVLPADRAR